MQKHCGISGQIPIETRISRDAQNVSSVTKGGTVLKELQWLPVEQRIIFKINLVCFKVLNNLAPSYLTEMLHVYEPARCLRSSSDKWRFAIEPYNLKTIMDSAFSVIAPRLWNDLPMAIRSTDNINYLNLS